MDDIIVIHFNKKYLEDSLKELEKELKKIGFTLNQEKTKIYPLKDGITFLGFKYRMTETGKIIMTLKKDTIRREKRHLRNLVRFCKKGKIPRSKVDECFEALLNHISKGNTYYYRQKFKKFYENLWRDYEKG